MYTYTINPLPVIDTVNQHAGLVLMFGIVGFVVFIKFLISFSMYLEQKLSDYLLLPPAALVLMYSTYVSFTTGTVITPENTVVLGKFVEFVGEQQQRSVKTGKTTQVVTDHVTYAVYKVEGNNIFITASQNLSYPETAIFYKNKKQERTEQ